MAESFFAPLISLVRQQREPRRLILHAGMRKTGSTSIQHFLHKANLKGTHYAKLGDANHSNAYVLLFHDEPQEYWVFKRQGRSRQSLLDEREKLMQKLRQQIVRSSPQTFVVSAEIISSGNHAMLQNCHDFFSEYFSDISVYAYARKPSSFAASMVQQSLKTGGLPSPTTLNPEYQRRFDALDQVFGKENTHIRLIDGKSAIPDTVANFLRWANIKSKVTSISKRNQSLAAEAVALLYLYRKSFRAPLNTQLARDSNRAFVRRLKKIKGKSFKVSPAFFDTTLPEIEEECRWLTNRIAEKVTIDSPSRQGAHIFQNLTEVEEFGEHVFERLTETSFNAFLQNGEPESRAESFRREVFMAETSSWADMVQSDWE